MKLFRLFMLTLILGASSAAHATTTTICQFGQQSDSDGDGWGWENSKSCQVATDIDDSCFDTGVIGDGWGWDGEKSCRVTDDVVGEICEDTGVIGDGWGWDGEKSCRITDTESSTACVDTGVIGDGWGWDGEKSCRTTVSGARVPGLDIERFVFITTENEFRTTTRPLQKFPDGATITYSISGTPTAEDLITVNEVITELTELTQLVFVEIYDQSATLKIYFEPVETFPSFIRGFNPGPGVTGTAQFTSNYKYVIFDASAAMDTGVSQFERDHATREEITQILGFTNDTYDQSDSIFHQYYNGVTSFSESDRRVIATMYTTGLTAGMTPDQIRAYLSP